MAYLPCSWYGFFFSFPLAVCQSISGDGICMPPNSSFIKCCIGYYLKEYQCYTGENCSWTCPSGYYGNLCNERCTCSPDKFCDPTRGCLCNSTSANCTDADQTVQTTVNRGTVVKTHSDQNREFIMNTVLPLLISMIGCLFIGSFCIRMRYVIIKKKRKDLHPTNNANDLHTRNQCPQNEENELSVVASPEVYNHLNLRVNYHNISHYYMDSMATGEDPPACHGLSSTDHSQPKEIRINWNLLRNDDKRNPDMLDKCSKKKGFGDRVHDYTKNEQLDIYSTPNKGVKMKQPNAFSKQRQQKNCCKTVKFKTTDTCQAAAVRKTDSQPNQTEESSISTHDGDLYANNNSLAYDNKCFRPESPMNQEDSDDYFDVSYDGYLAMSSSQNNSPGHTKSASSETDPDLSDYVNADGLDSYR
uniref:Uncharacterized protein n=1 Tax=Magallana gigas TaxID=29159 RepID=A0A8W8KK16_MAGGI